MASAEYEEKIRRFNYDKIIELWNDVRSGNDLADWKGGKAFEYLILRAFELEGVKVSVKVKYPYSIWVEGKQIEEIDGVIYMSRYACMVESKDRDERIDVEPIAKLRNQLLRRPASVIGAVFCRTEFTSPAIFLASFLAPQTALLWKGKDIDEALKKGKMSETMEQKYEAVIEYGLPDFDSSAK